LVKVAETSNSEYSPDVACNPDDSSCLIVWAYMDTTTMFIDGSFFDVSVSNPGGLTSDGGKFTISTKNASAFPNITIGSSAYLVTYRWFDGTAIWPVYSHVHPSIKPPETNTCTTHSS